MPAAADPAGLQQPVRDGRMDQKPTYEQLEQRVRELEQALEEKSGPQEQGPEGTGSTRAALQESEERFRELFEHMGSGVAVYQAVDGGADFIFKAFNSAAEQITRISREKAVGKRLLELFPQMEESGLPAALRRVWESGKEEHLAPFFYRDEIREGWRENRIYKLPSGEVVAIFDDVTVRKQAELELKSRKQLLEGILDSIKDVIGVQLPDHTILQYNRAGYELLGITEADLDGRKCFEFIGRNRQCRVCATDKALQSKKMETVEKYVPELGGYYVCTSNPVLDENGEVEVVIEQLADITEQKKTHELLRRSQKIEAIGNLAGGIAHDFNNILFPIVGMAEMLLDDLPKGSAEHESASEIYKAGMRASELVNQILAFSRRAEKKLIPVRIQKVLKEVLKLSRATIPSDIEIREDVQRDCRTVMADPTQLHQVAMNLVTNAFHAVEPAGGTISVHLCETFLEKESTESFQLEPGHYAVLSVSDTGQGIAPDVIDRIFDPYFTTKEQNKGTGLGLSVVHGIVREYAGDIRVESEPGRGTDVRIYLPVMEEHGKENSFEKEGLPPTGTEHILLVDDEEPVAEMEKKMLEKLGYRVTACTGSREALECFRENPDRFDLFITDMTMPEMTGDRLAAELMALKPEIPGIICTGFSERMSPEKAEDMGISGFLMKPLIMNDLAETVRRVLDRAD